jgi:hypothetical protein
VTEPFCVLTGRALPSSSPMAFTDNTSDEIPDEIAPKVRVAREKLAA